MDKPISRTEELYRKHSTKEKAISITDRFPSAEEPATIFPSLNSGRLKKNHVDGCVLHCTMLKAALKDSLMGDGVRT